MLSYHSAVIAALGSLLCAWTVFGADEQTSHSTSSHGDSSHGDSSHGDSSHGDSSHGDSSHADPNVFVLGRYFDYDTFVILLSIVGGSAMVFELVLSRYEEWLKREGDTFQKTLYEKILRELMTLGVVSFALFLLQPVTNGTLLLIFEFAHYVIFFMAIFTVIQLVLLGASTYPIKRAWDVAAYKSKEELLEGYSSMEADMRKWSVPVPWVGLVSLDVYHWGKKWRWIDSAQYHLARSIFIRQHGCAANFDFAKYACLVTDKQILSMAEVPLRSWLVLLVLHWVAYGLREGLSREDDTVSFEAWFVFGMILFLLEMLLLVACVLGMRRIYVKLGADPRKAAGTVDVVLERIWVAPVTSVQHSRQERKSSLEAVKAVAATARVGGEELESGGGGGVRAGGEGGEGAGAVKAAEGGIPEITTRDAFFFGSCNAYRIAVEVLMLLNSYHLAVYAVYFIGPALKSSTEWVWIVVLPLPILFGVLIAYRRVLPMIALLSTIVMLQPMDVASVEQEAEELNRLRRKLVMRVEDVLRQELIACTKKGEVLPDDQTSACFLVKRWDLDGNGTLSYDELEKGLTSFGLVLSSKQRRELLRLADPDRSGSVDVKELTDLLFDVEVEMAAAAAAAGEGGGGTGEGDAVGGGVDESSDANARVERMLWKRASQKWS